MMPNDSARPVGAPPFILIKGSLFLGVAMFFVVSCFIHMQPNSPTFDWHGAPPIAHQLAPLALLLGAAWVWFWRKRARFAANAATRSSYNLITIAGAEGLALAGVVMFLLTRDPILIAWAAPMFLVALVV